MLSFMCLIRYWGAGALPASSRDSAQTAPGGETAEPWHHASALRSQPHTGEKIPTDTSAAMWGLVSVKHIHSWCLHWILLYVNAGTNAQNLKTFQSHPIWRRTGSVVVFQWSNTDHFHNLNSPNGQLSTELTQQKLRGSRHTAGFMFWLDQSASTVRVTIQESCHNLNC